MQGTSVPTFLSSPIEFAAGDGGSLGQGQGLLQVDELPFDKCHEKGDGLGMLLVVGESLRGSHRGEEIDELGIVVELVVLPLEEARDFQWLVQGRRAGGKEDG